MKFTNDFINNTILKGLPDKTEDRNTTSLVFKRDIINAFSNPYFEDKHCLEIGCHHGHTTRVLSFLFKTVTATIVKTTLEPCADRDNVIEQNWDAYSPDGWPIDGYYDVIFIDAIHTREHVLSDIKRALSLKSHGPKYIVFDDFWMEGPQRGIIEAINSSLIRPIMFIGQGIGWKYFERTLPAPEGIICEEVVNET